MKIYFEQQFYLSTINQLLLLSKYRQIQQLYLNEYLLETLMDQNGIFYNIDFILYFLEIAIYQIIELYILFNKYKAKIVALYRFPFVKNFHH